MHQGWTIQAVAPGTGSSGTEQEGEAHNPRIEHPGKWGQSRRRNGKRTTSNIKQKEEPEEDAPALDHPRSDTQNSINQGRSTKERPPAPGLEHPGIRGQRSRRNGKKAPSGNKEKVGPEEDAPGSDHSGSDAPD